MQPSNDGKPLASIETKRVAAEWKSLPPEAKEAFNDDAKAEMEKLKETEVINNFCSLHFMMQKWVSLTLF